MSGGSLDYTFGRVTDAAESIRSRSRKPLHRAFAAHLDKVSTALHDLEWVFSGDYGDGDEVEAIKAVVSSREVTLQIKSDLEDSIKEAQMVLSDINYILEQPKRLLGMVTHKNYLAMSLKPSKT